MEPGGTTLSGKKISTVKLNCNGDLFYELWKAHQPQIPSLTPTTIQTCQINGGEVGSMGCVLFWNYFHDGKDCFVKSLIDDIDEDKKSVTYKVLEGDVLEQHKTFVVTVGVDTEGSDTIVTWTTEYEKLSPDVPDPDTLMDFFVQATKEIETQCLQSAVAT